MIYQLKSPITHILRIILQIELSQLIYNIIKKSFLIRSKMHNLVIVYRIRFSDKTEK
jgi:hypothetical protein